MQLFFIEIERVWGCSCEMMAGRTTKLPLVHCHSCVLRKKKSFRQDGGAIVERANKTTEIE